MIVIATNKVQIKIVEIQLQVTSLVETIQNQAMKNKFRSNNQ